MIAGAADGCELPDEQAITAARDETKYRLEPDQIGTSIAELTRYLPSHRYAGDGANRLPDAHHYITTVYFDTPSRRHLDASRRDRNNNVKVRAREYYDVHPSLAELATSRQQVFRASPWVFIEVKHRTGTRTQKERFRLARDAFAGFVQGLAAPGSESLSQHVESLGIRKAAPYLLTLSEPLTSCCLVNYRRVSWQQAAIGLRITLDLGIAFYPPPRDLHCTTAPLVRSSLGIPCQVERQAVLEVKQCGGAPSWLEELLDRARAMPSDFSKFLAAMEAVSATDG